MQKGLISVIMGVHNEREEYLRLAVDSICKQTYKCFEFIIIDDCSNDNCVRILQNLSSEDSRIHIFRNEINLGLTKSLNRGLSLANGEFIARMDADDFSVPNRFEKQLAYLQKHQDIDILGGGVVSFGDEIKFMSPALGYTNNTAQCALFFQSTLCHPSVIIRKSFLDRTNIKYDVNIKKGQDYDMWERCSIYGKIAVMKDVILYYRIHKMQISSLNNDEQNNTANIVRIRRLNRVGIYPTDKEMMLHLLLLGGRNRSVKCSEVKNWMYKILEANYKNEIVNSKCLKKDLGCRFVLYKLKNRHFSFCDIEYIVRIIIGRMRMRMKLCIESSKIKHYKI